MEKEEDITVEDTMEEEVIMEEEVTMEGTTVIAMGDIMGIGIDVESNRV